MENGASQAITDAPDRGEMSFRREQTLEIIQEEVEEKLWHEEEQEKKGKLWCHVVCLIGKHYKNDLLRKWHLFCLIGKSQPRRNETGGKASKVRDDGSTDGFCFLAKRKELPTTDARQSPKQLWLEYCQAETLGESKTLLSKPLYDKRSEAENFINYSSKPAEHCTSAEKHNAIIPDNDRLLCKVCYMNELSIVFLPCSHMVACRRCAARLKLCPVCRSGIKEALPANLHE